MFPNLCNGLTSAKNPLIFTMKMMKAFHHQFQGASESRRYKVWVSYSFSSLSQQQLHFCILQKLICLPWGKRWQNLIGINTVLLTCKQYQKSKSITIWEVSAHQEDNYVYCRNTLVLSKPFQPFIKSKRKKRQHSSALNSWLCCNMEKY